MTVATENVHNQKTVNLLYFNRVKTEIPVIKMGYDFISHIYYGLKDSSAIMQWSLEKVSTGAETAIQYPLSYVKKPLKAVDHMLCTTLDLAELNLPMLTKTPGQLYDESINYVVDMVHPITEWVDMELLPPAEYYVDYFLPELEPEKNKGDDKKSRVLRLASTIVRRTFQHAYAEPKYLLYLTINATSESFAMIKMLIVDQKLLLTTFNNIWKKLGDGVSPDEAAKSKLLVEMGCVRLLNGSSVIVKTIEVSADIAKCYIEMFYEYIKQMKDSAIDGVSRIVTPTTKPQKQQKQAPINPPKTTTKDAPKEEASTSKAQTPAPTPTQSSSSSGSTPASSEKS
ncbi:uncharacterized protein LOC126902488 [Daktulosphaira vitifoliae]|uniref:uncharacterized protein LOC126902488 n=1 Tax=Daktulosphaira vitifoliae TaxID=58002 RepID=UPI0021AAE6BC|nr:uncharacterized protein LOC126902488 [Daktulosphaira vitifoliae]